MFNIELEDWKPVSRVAVFGWLAFYAIFLFFAATNKTGFMLIDNVNLIVHEAGHLLFSWLGNTASLWGGTIFQWLVPALLATYFFFQRQTAGFVFCVFMFFENLLYTATYMADARAQVLPLVTVGGGGGDDAPHDWFRIFSSLGLLRYDVAIARLVRVAGWLGMIGSVLWLASRLRTIPASQQESLE